MSIGPLGGILAGAAGSPLAQSQGSDVERAASDAASQQRSALRAEQAEAAAGIAQTDGEEHEAEERDADGRRLWEEPPAGRASEPADERGGELPRPPDASGERGTQLDLAG